MGLPAHLFPMLRSRGFRALALHGASVAFFVRHGLMDTSRSTDCVSETGTARAPVVNAAVSAPASTERNAFAMQPPQSIDVSSFVVKHGLKAEARDPVCRCANAR